MSSKAVASASHLLFVLSNCSRKTFAAILTDQKIWKKVLSALIEIAFNYLYEDVGLSRSEAKQIFKHRRFLDKPAAKGGVKPKKSLFKKRNIALQNHKAIKTLIPPLKGSLSHLLLTPSGDDNE